MDSSKTTMIAEEFSGLKDIVFANAAHVIIPPKCVLSAYNGFTERYVSRHAQGILEEAWQIIDNARKEIANLINAKPDEIAFVKNTCESMGIISNGFPFKKGDNVILVDQEHPSNLFPWIKLHEQQGVELEIVKNKNWDISEDELLERVNENTKAIVISAVQFTTGVYVDLKKIGDFCRKNNILFIVDGIQAIGRMNIDVTAMNIDYLGCGSNKGLLSMLGAGFLFCRKGLIEKITPPYVGFQSVDNFVSPPALTTDYSKIHWKKDAGKFEAGNLNYSGIAAINSGVSLVNSLGIIEIEKHILNLQETLFSMISEMNLSFRTPIENIDHWSGIICIYYDAGNEKQIRAIMDRHKIITTYRGGYIRFALNFYNTEEQLEIIKDALDEIRRY